MGENVGKTDKILRLSVGVVLLVLALNASGAMQWLAFVLAGVMVVTALMSRCPLYRVLGISTCGTRG